MAMTEDGRFEVLEGDLRMVPAPGGAHQWALAKLGAHLIVFVEQRDLGYCFPAPFDVVLAPDTVLQPDFCFVAKERFEGLYDGHGLTGAPDLVIEFLSKSTAKLDRTTRRALFAKAGVRWLIFVDPADRRVEELRLQGDDYVLASEFGAEDLLELEAFPGFSIALGTIWLRVSR